MPAPDDPAALLEDAETKADAGRFDEAIALCDKALARDFNSAAALNLKGFCLSQLGRVEEALSAFQGAKLALPVYAPIRYNAARALDELGRLVEAAAEYGEALALEADHLEARLYRGFCRARLGDAAGAAADLDEVLARSPDLAQAWVLRGACRLMASRRDLAEADFRRAVELDPSQKEAVERFLAELGG